MRTYRPAVGCVALALVALAGPAASGAEPDAMLQPPDSTRLISRALDGASGNESSGGPSVSTDGTLIAYSSHASDLVAGDDNDAYDVFVYDRRADQTTRVSLDVDGESPDGDSYASQLAAGGRYVVFLSRASDLVPVDTDGELQTYLFDRVEGTTTLVTLNAAGRAANGDTWQVTVDAKGRFVAYVSEASNLAPDDTNGVTDVFVYDVRTGATTLITRNSSGAVANGAAHGVDITDDGQVVAIASYATDLVADDANDSSDVFTLDRSGGAWALVSRNRQGLAATGNSYGPSLSPDGSHLAFDSAAPDLAGRDDNEVEDVFLLNRSSGHLRLLSRGLDGWAAGADSHTEVVSRGARAVTFFSWADDLVTGDDNSDLDIFLRDRRDGITLVSKTKDGSPGDFGSFGSALDGPANVVVFASSATNLVPDDGNSQGDVFVYRRP